MFFSSDPDELLHHVSFYEINSTSVAEQLQYATDAYYNMWNNYVDEVCVANRPCIEQDGDPVEPLRLEYALLSHEGESSVVANVTSSATLGPYSAGRSRAEYAKVVQDTIKATLRLSLKSYSADQFYLMGDTCVLWHFDVVLELHNPNGRMKGYLKQNPISACAHDANLPHDAIHRIRMGASRSLLYPYHICNFANIQGLHDPINAQAGAYVARYIPYFAQAILVEPHFGIAKRKQESAQRSAQQNKVRGRVEQGDAWRQVSPLGQFCCLFAHRRRFPRRVLLSGALNVGRGRLFARVHKRS